MKVTFKTLLQEVFSLDFDPQTTVGSIKTEIEKIRSHDPANQVIIYSGKILKDDDTLESLKFQEKDFMVLMVTKTPAKTSNEPSKEQEKEKPEPETDKTVELSDVASASTLTMGKSYENTVKSLMEMGFPRDKVVMAMRAAFNNPDRAAEYLVSGIPENVQSNLAESDVRENISNSSSALQALNPRDPEAIQPNVLESAARVLLRAFENDNWSGRPNEQLIAETQDQLSQLENSAQFQQIRQLIESDPQAIQPVIDQLAQINPNLAQIWRRDNDALLSLLRTGNTGSGQDEVLSGENWQDEYSSSVTLTEEEVAAVERLEALGFERALAIEAFFACDKNEELAANYLFNFVQSLN